MNELQQSLRQIFEGYADQKTSLTELLSENKRYNATLKGTIDEKTYEKVRRKVQIKDFPLAHLIASGLPKQIASSAALSKKEYLIEGSIGKGNIAEIPWVCVFDRAITTSAESGYYIVLLFTKDSKGAYLSLNQGCTQYYNHVKGLGKKRREALQLLRKNALSAQRILRSVFDFDFAPISLGSSDDLGLGYEAGNICSKYYSLMYLPTDDALIDDLRDLLGVYRELKGLVGQNIMAIDVVGSEEGFQEEVQLAKRKQLASGPVEKKTRSKTTVLSAYYRDPNMAYTALENAGFACEVNPLHETFVSGRSGQNFVEAHHLIPMEFQDQFEKSIDVPENIISLCPNCHRAFHYAEDSFKSMLIEKFILLRQRGLQSRGIDVSLEGLRNYYMKEQDRSILSLA